MGFLAPFVGPALGIVGGLFGGGQSKQAKASSDLLAKAQQRGFGVADTAERQATPLLSAGSQFLPQAGNYFQSLLSGGRGRLMQEMAPELDQVGANFAGARNAISALPRGGGRTSALAQLPGQQAAAQTRLLSSVRPQAASNLLNVGREALGSGSSLLNTSVQGIYGGNTAANSLLNYDLQRQAANRESQQGVGSSIFDLVQLLSQMGQGGTRSAGAGDYTRLPLPS